MRAATAIDGNRAAPLAHTATRRCRRARRRALAVGTAKAMVGIVLAFALVLSPWAPSLLPTDGPSLGTSPAHAQTQVQVQDQDSGENENADQPQTRAPGDECAERDGEAAPLPGVNCGTSSRCPSDPDDWRDGWQADADDPSRCVLVMDACPQSPLQQNRQPHETYMEPAMDYPEFCEVRVLQSEARALFDDCMGRPSEQSLGFWGLPGSPPFSRFERTINTSDGDDRECTAIVPSRCPSGMSRLRPGDDGQPDAGNPPGVDNEPGGASLDPEGSDIRDDFPKCRQYQRRTWRCPGETVPRNQFNTCYQRLSSDSDGSHPACLGDVPRFEISDCETYVGRDYMQNPVQFGCNRYDTGSAFALTPFSNDYWCTYVRQGLELRCHGPTASCSETSEAVCIKRASHTGGCTSVASTIRCRAQQANVRDAKSTATELLRQGCAPCTILPFAPVPSGAVDTPTSPNCPNAYSEPPEARNEAADLIRTLERQGSIDARAITGIASHCTAMEDAGGKLRDHPACANSLNQGFCSPPSLTALEWTTASGSGAGVINAPVIVSFVSTRTAFTNSQTAYRYLSFTFNGDHGPLNFSDIREARSARLQQQSLGQTMVYADMPADAPQVLVTQWPTPRTRPIYPPPRFIDSVAAFLADSGGGCYVRSPPLHRLIVEELWPDTDAPEIERLFGQNAMEQWATLTDEQKEALSTARGFTFLGESESLNAGQIESERESRERLLRQLVACNAADDSQQWWCRWVPQRSGYYRLTGETAWTLQRWLGPKERRWLRPSEWDAANNALRNLGPSDDTCEVDAVTDRVKDADCILEDLGRWKVTPAQAGLVVDPDGSLGLVPLPPGTDDEIEDALYAQASQHIHRCPSQDVRVWCNDDKSNLFFAYETTDPIGIAVQQTRVVTRQASGAAGP